MDSYRQLTTQELLTSLTHSETKPRYNLSKKERKAITTLSEDESIVIKPADKGGAIVILNTEDYIKECERQLTNTSHYKRLYHNPTKEFNQQILNTLIWGKERGIITLEELNFLYNKSPQISNFYCLPKIHKEGNPGRPIVNSIGSITEKISAYVDQQIKELSKLVHHILKIPHIIST